MTTFPSLTKDIEIYNKYYKRGWMSITIYSAGEINRNKEKAIEFLLSKDFVIEREDRITKDLEDRNSYMIYKDSGPWKYTVTI